MNHQAEHLEELLKQERAKVAALEAEKAGRQQAVPSIQDGVILPRKLVERIARALWAHNYIFDSEELTEALAAAQQAEHMLSDTPAPAPAAPDVAGLCMLVAETAYKEGGGKDRAVRSDVLRQIVNDALATFHREG